MSAKTIYDELLKVIKNPFGVCGVMGNLKAESNLRANNLQNSFEKKLGMNESEYTSAVDNGLYTNFVHDSAGYGLAQWTYWSRKEKLLKYAKAYGSSIGDEQMQVAFLIGEITAGYKGLLDTLRNAKSVKEASDAVLTQYERPDNMSDDVKKKRAAYGEEFYNELCIKNVDKVRSRKAVVELAKSWLGKNEADGSYNSIIDIYNSYDGYFPRGTKMNYCWAWCACTWSALAIKLGYTDIMPIEISCFYLIKKAQEMGIWQENDEYIPNPGDAILYDWDDNGVGDNTGIPEHVGVIEKVVGKEIIVIEGNFSNEVKRRIIPVNGRHIRGFITPKYDVEQESTNQDTYVEHTKAKSYASHKDDSLSGTYYTTSDLWMRDGAGTDKPKMVVIPEGTKCMNYGYYSLSNGTKWLYIVATIGDTKYIGFSSSKYLMK